ncbi:hypothetical protein [Nostoc parmelioides]|uniref:Uncharacterized protein n=1 Tax=Nostoc parmelioides FACHB-3921 TaxID=2692909 RepID=A0ABR8B8R4_9NOSO|nr:hypothetical protein [Nostoc parmelioides]MBD2250325.1 hypothetical protein [Nostoc parmelioides FACHB-3921]
MIIIVIDETLLPKYFQDVRVKCDRYGDALSTQIIINQPDYDSNNICASNLRGYLMSGWLCV